VALHATAVTFDGGQHSRVHGVEIADGEIDAQAEGQGVGDARVGRHHDAPLDRREVE